MLTGSLNLELVILTVQLLVPLTIALFYRPPGSHSVILDNILTALCTHINPSLLSNFILLGNFNVNFFD